MNGLVCGTLPAGGMAEEFTAFIQRQVIHLALLINDATINSD